MASSYVTSLECTSKTINAPKVRIWAGFEIGLLIRSTNSESFASSYLKTYLRAYKLVSYFKIPFSSISKVQKT